MSSNHLIVIVGPTAVGKTARAIQLASDLGTEIINADSRQVFREMIIGTAVPSKDEQTEVKHHFLGHHSIQETYNASSFEQEVIAFLHTWFNTHQNIIMVGGSGLYIDAVCKGIDDLPSVDKVVRKKIREEYENGGLTGIRLKLKEVDPDYYEKVDLDNPLRIMKALEIKEMSGKPYSSYLTGRPKLRNFNIVKIGLDLPRKNLHERINERVDRMMAVGLLEEVSALYPCRHLNALNTVGYKELFDYIDGKCSLDAAVEKMKAHTRQYARRQLTWFHKDKDTRWHHPDELLHPVGVGVPRWGI
jgi:tRNA dimethylallyltransferase